MMSTKDTSEKQQPPQRQPSRLQEEELRRSYNYGEDGQDTITITQRVPLPDPPPPPPKEK
jgi:hypothetical protein